MPKSAGAGETKYVNPETFFAELPAVMKAVPPLPGEEALYKWIGSVLDAAAKDPAIMQTLKETAVAAENELLPPFLLWRNNGRPVGNGWNSPVNNGQWGTDYLNRTATAKSNMYDNRPNETKYIYTDDDSAGKQLNGQNLYTITFPKGQTPPVKGFWSVTLYNDLHLWNPNPLKRYSLGTKNKTLKYNADGSLTLYAGAKSPGADKESNWLQAPNGTFSLYIRAYWAASQAQFHAFTDTSSGADDAFPFPAVNFRAILLFCRVPSRLRFSQYVSISPERAEKCGTSARRARFPSRPWLRPDPRGDRVSGSMGRSALGLTAGATP